MSRAMKPSVLFVCRHNTGRSQMAEAYLRHFLGDRVDVASAGTVGAELPDPAVVAVMAEDGIDISNTRPKLLDAPFPSQSDNDLNGFVKSAKWSNKKRSENIRPSPTRTRPRRRRARR
jgi:hypothetical protein